MKKLSVGIFTLAVLFTLATSFKSPYFNGYRVFLFGEDDPQPHFFYQYNPEWYDQNLLPDAQREWEYDLDEIVDPSESPGDELCVSSSLICVAQIKIIYDQVDWSFGVDLRMGSLVE